MSLLSFFLLSVAVYIVGSAADVYTTIQGMKFTDIVESNGWLNNFVRDPKTHKFLPWHGVLEKAIGLGAVLIVGYFTLKYAIVVAFAVSVRFYLAAVFNYLLYRKDKHLPKAPAK